MMDDRENDEVDTHHLPSKSVQQSNSESTRGFLLLDANEHLTVRLIFVYSVSSQRFLSVGKY